ncbi:MAG: aldose 1-epimerase family protein [Pseudonocardia sp.]
MDARDLTFRHGDQVAVVTTSGAALRSYTVADCAVLDGTGPGEPITGGRGQLLVPWPNRIADATYRFDGQEYHLPVTEASTGSAIHGLVRKVGWEVLDERPDAVRLGVDVAAQPGYPFTLRTEVTYTLGPDGLATRLATTNTGDHSAPYAAGAHPYLTAGTGLIDDLTVEVPAATWYPTDARSLPTGREPVDGTPLDLRTAQRFGGRRIDNAYTDLIRDADGRARVRLTAPGGRTVTVAMDAACTHLQIFTGDHVPEPSRRRRGIAVEPMTAAPDAFNSGDGLVTLDPGATHVAEWSVHAA